MSYLGEGLTHSYSVVLVSGIGCDRTYSECNRTEVVGLFDLDDDCVYECR